jgi:Arc/MetJ-type ribon-helix-helix transcriptional regulator
MVEVRVTMDDRLNKLLDEVVDSGIYQGKAELMRSATV